MELTLHRSEQFRPYGVSSSMAGIANHHRSRMRDVRSSDCSPKTTIPHISTSSVQRRRTSKLSAEDASSFVKQQRRHSLRQDMNPTHDSAAPHAVLWSESIHT